MAGSLMLVKWLLGILCVFFSYYLGRCLARRFLFQDHKAPLNRWAFRAVVAGLAVLWSGRFDTSSWLVVASAVMAGAIGFHHERRPKKPEEDLAKVMFPKE